MVFRASSRSSVAPGRSLFLVRPAPVMPRHASSWQAKATQGRGVSRPYDARCPVGRVQDERHCPNLDVSVARQRSDSLHHRESLSFDSLDSLARSLAFSNNSRNSFGRPNHSQDSFLLRLEKLGKSLRHEVHNGLLPLHLVLRSLRSNYLWFICSVYLYTRRPKEPRDRWKPIPLE